MGSVDSAVHPVIIHIFRKNSRVPHLAHLGRGNYHETQLCIFPNRISEREQSGP
jgi:polyphosphate kinase